MSCSSAYIGNCIRLPSYRNTIFKNHLRSSFKISVSTSKFHGALWSSSIDVPGRLYGFKFIPQISKNSITGFDQNSLSGNGNDEVHGEKSLLSVSLPLPTSAILSPCPLQYDFSDFTIFDAVIYQNVYVILQNKSFNTIQSTFRMKKKKS